MHFGNLAIRLKNKSAQSSTVAGPSTHSGGLPVETQKQPVAPQTQPKDSKRKRTLEVDVDTLVVAMKKAKIQDTKKSAWDQLGEMQWDEHSGKLYGPWEFDQKPQNQK